MNNEDTNGQGSHILQVRLNKEQHERLKALASASGYATTSSYVRTQLLNPSLEMKVNKILSMLSKEEVQADGE